MRYSLHLRVIEYVQCKDVTRGAFVAFQLVFNVDNGRGEIVSKYVPTVRNALCDGEWHTIKGMHFIQTRILIECQHHTVMIRDYYSNIRAVPDH